MIVLDVESEHYKSEFERYKTPPTHARIAMIRWSLPENQIKCHDIGYHIMMRPHVEAIYVYGRVNDRGEFYQDESDCLFQPAHAALDMTEYETSPNIGPEGAVIDSPERTEYLKECERRNTIRRNLLSDKTGPHRDDPTQAVESSWGKNRFSEEDLDIIFSHTDHRLKGRSVPDL